MVSSVPLGQLHIMWTVFMFVRVLTHLSAFSCLLESCECYPCNCVFNDSVHRKEWIPGIAFAHPRVFLLLYVAHTHTHNIHTLAVLHIL